MHSKNYKPRLKRRDWNLLRTALQLSALLICIAGSTAPAFGKASSPVTVRLLPFDVFGVAQADEQELLEYFENQVLMALQAQVEKVDPLSPDRVIHLQGEWADFLEKTHTDYVVEGSLRVLGNEHVSYLSLGLELRSYGRLAGSDRTWLVTIPQDLSLAIHVMDHLIDQLIDSIDGEPQKKIVYTYCFHTLSRDTMLDQLRRHIPRRLRDALEEGGLGDRYRVESFRTPSQIDEICNKDLDPSALTIFEYVISGEVSPLGDGGVEVYLEVFRSEHKDREVLPMFQHPTQSTAMIDPLAAFILDHWRSVAEDR